MKKSTFNSLDFIHKGFRYLFYEISVELNSINFSDDETDGALWQKIMRFFELYQRFSYFLRISVIPVAACKISIESLEKESLDETHKLKNCWQAYLKIQEGKNVKTEMIEPFIVRFHEFMILALKKMQTAQQEIMPVIMNYLSDRQMIQWFLEPVQSMDTQTYLLFMRGLFSSSRYAELNEWIRCSKTFNLPMSFDALYDHLEQETDVSKVPGRETLAEGFFLE